MKAYLPPCRMRICSSLENLSPKGSLYCLFHECSNKLRICQWPFIKSPCQGHPKSPLDRLACPVHPLLVYRIEDPIGRLSCPCTGHRISRSMSDLPKLDDMELRIAQIGGVVDCNEKPATIEISTEEAGGSSSATTQNPS